MVEFEIAAEGPPEVFAVDLHEQVKGWPAVFEDEDPGIFGLPDHSLHRERRLMARCVKGAAQQYAAIR
jgi:hypothetical protein